MKNICFHISKKEASIKLTWFQISLQMRKQSSGNKPTIFLSIFASSVVISFLKIILYSIHKSSYLRLDQELHLGLYHTSYVPAASVEANSERCRWLLSDPSPICPSGHHTPKWNLYCFNFQPLVLIDGLVTIKISFLIMFAKERVIGVCRIHTAHLFHLSLPWYYIFSFTAVV